MELRIGFSMNRGLAIANSALKIELGIKLNLTLNPIIIRLQKSHLNGFKIFDLELLRITHK